MSCLSRKRILLVGAACILVAGAVVFLWPSGPKEPEYQGKKLSEWLIEADFGDGNPKATRTAEAITQLGDSSLPWLVKWVSLDVPQWQYWCLEKVTRAFGSKAPFAAQMHRKYTLAFAAMKAFSILGPAGKPAIPRLCEVAKRERSQASGRALDCLRYIGCDAVPPLVELLNKGNFGAALCLSELHRDSQCDVAAAVPGILLVDRATHVYASKREGCYVYCGNIFFDDPARFTPLIRDCLKHPNRDVRAEAAKIVGSLSRDPQTIIGLRKALEDPVLEVRVEATNALRKIAPQILNDG
jgi:hypothetical protein